MVVLYVVSAEEVAGKTAICAGLGKYLQGNGKKVGYLKLLSNDNNDGDTVFMKQILGLSEDAATLRLGGGNVTQVKEACDKASQGKDVVIVESRLGDGANEMAKALNARVIIVEAYSGQASASPDGYKVFGENLLGVVLNKVPRSQLKRVQDETSKQFGAAGVKVLGVLPEDRVLFAITVGELADNIQGKILNNADKSAELVENFMLGAMVVDSGLDYFGRKSNKAAVVRGDRPDMQLAALETSTRCLVLSSSDQPPIYSVLEKAENRGIPIIATEAVTGDIVAGIEDALSRARFSQEKKLSKLAEVMKQHLDLQAVL